jgi:hypothetical protein
VKAIVKYGPSDGYFAYEWHNIKISNQIKMVFSGSGEKVNFKVLLPHNTEAKSVYLDGAEIVFSNSTTRQSNYANFEAQIESVHNLVINYE